MIRSIYYHNPTPEEFEKMVKYLIKHHYKFLSHDELYSLLLDEEVNVNKKKYVFVSFDDGWRDNLKLIPIIEKYSFPITIFVSVEPIISGNFWWEYVCKVEGHSNMMEFKKLPYKEFYQELEKIKSRVVLKRSALTLEELQKIAHHPLISIQSHTINHPILTSVPDDILDYELKESKVQLENMIDCPVNAFSYPNGSLSDREIAATKKFYKIAFTTEQNNISFENNMYELPRYALTGDFNRDLLKMYGIWKHIRNFFQSTIKKVK